MLRVVTGLFRPDLELALAADLRPFTTDPTARCLILVPSERLRAHLTWTFCIEKSQPLFNVHLLTFHQLALRVLEEGGHQEAVRLRSESFFQEWVHQRLRKEGAGLPGLNELASMPGAWAALWSTIKDLKDARVDTGAVSEAFSQGSFSADRRLQSVLRLYQAWCDDQNRHALYDYDDLAVLALDLVSASSWLRQQAHVFYYGFYDLTQGQLDLFRTIVRQYPATLYFPLLDQHPAFRFAQQFFDQHVRGLAAGPIEHRVESVDAAPFRDLFDPARAFRSRNPEVPDEPGPFAEGAGADAADRNENPRPGENGTHGFCRLVTVSGSNDEIDVVAKEILALVHEQRIPLHEIGVVARTLGGYEDVLSRVFSAHGIPIQATLRRPLSQYPFPQTLLRLLSLRLSDFDRNATFDVLQAPFVNWQTVCPGLSTPRPDAWEQMSRQIGIEKGAQDWDRLVGMFEPGVSMPRREEIPGEEARNLWHVVQQFTRLLGVFPEEAGWDVFTDLTRSLVNHVLSASPRDALRMEDGSEETTEGSRRAVLECLSEIRTLTRVSGPVHYAEFLETLRRFMEVAWNPWQPENGVRVVDAMAARGLSFRVLFVIGLTDHVFPRHIREDGFLRDSARRFLDVHLGFKIQEKARGYDEEKLLFYLLMHAAREKVVLVAQRSDEEARPTVPSWYLQEVERCLPGLAPEEVPRSVRQQPQAGPYADESRWTPRERLVRYVLDRREPGQATEGESAWWQVVQKGLAALREQESDRSHLNAYDGITGPLPEHWEFLSVHGLSPTRLEPYATCPFQYFARTVLGLDVPRTAPLSQGLSALDVGTLLHGILKEWYDRLVQNGWFAQVVPSDEQPLDVLKQVAESVFVDFERENPVGPALLWEMQQEHLMALLERLLEQDMREMGHEWRPVLFEVPLKGEMTMSQGTTPIPIAGRLDRVDWSPSRRQYRIIDYKFTKGRVMTNQQLTREVMRGTRLQPLFYMELAGQGIPPLLAERLGEEGRGVTCEGVWFYVIAPRELSEERGFVPVAFSSDMRDAITSQLEATMTVLVQGIREGKFFIVPGRHCEWCSVKSLCHRTHPGSDRRAREDDGQTRVHRTLRRQQLPKSVSATSQPDSAGES